MITFPLPLNKAIRSLSQKLAASAMSTAAPSALTTTAHASSHFSDDCVVDFGRMKITSSPAIHSRRSGAEGKQYATHNGLGKRCFSSAVNGNVSQNQSIGSLSNEGDIDMCNLAANYAESSMKHQTNGSPLSAPTLDIDQLQVGKSQQCSIKNDPQQLFTDNQQPTPELLKTENQKVEAGLSAEGDATNPPSNPYIALTMQELIERYNEAKSQQMTLAEYNDFIFAFRFKRLPEQALLILEDMKMASVQPDAKSYANVFLSGINLFFANELEDLIASNVAIFSNFDKKADIKKRLAQTYLEAANEMHIEFQGEFYAPVILSCTARDYRKEFAAAAYVFARICVDRNISVSYSVYSYTMASLNRHDMDSLVVALYEALPETNENYHLHLHYLRALIKLERSTEAFRLLGPFMEGKEKKIQIFNVLINSALKKSNVTVARSLYNKLISMDIKPDDATIALFIEHAGRMIENAQALIDEFSAEASAQNVPLGGKFYNALLKTYSRINVNKCSEILIQASSENCIDKGVLETVITMLADNRIPSYLKLELYTAISKITSGKQPKDAFVASMYALIDSRILELFATIEEFTMNAVAPDAKSAQSHTVYSEPAYRAIMRSFVSRKQLDAVLALAEHIIGHNMQFTSVPNYLFNVAAETAIERSDWMQASDIVRNMKYRGIALKPYVKEKYETLRSKSSRSNSSGFTAERKASRNTNEEIEEFEDF